MITTGAHASRRTKRFHAISVSDAMNRTAPHAAATAPYASADATITEITATYVMTGGRSARSSIAPTTREPRGTATMATGTSRTMVRSAGERKAATYAT